MSRLRWSYVVALSAVIACHPARDKRARSSAPPRPAAASHSSTPRLPEDEAAGKVALAQWTEHLEEEERTRQANYDRRRLSEHQALLAIFEASRTSYDKARSKAAVARVQAQLRARLPGLQSRLKHIDRWGKSSRALKDHQALLELLSHAYPNGRLAALDGDPGAAQRLAAELDARLTSAHAWLAFAATAEDE